MSEDDVWAAEGAALGEDFGPFDYDPERVADAVKIDHFLLWGLKALQSAPTPLILGGFALWAIGLVTGVLAQFANIGGNLAAAASIGDPMIQQGIATLSPVSYTHLTLPTILRV